MHIKYSTLRAVFLYFFVMLSCIAVQYALADDIDSSITKNLCYVTNALQGNVGKTIAILIVITVAVSLFLGKITWGVAITIAVGMGLLFGSTTIIGIVSKGDAKTATDPCAKQV